MEHILLATFLIKPRRKINSLFRIIRNLPINCSIYSKVELNVSSCFPRCLGDENKIISIHEMIEIIPELIIKTRNLTCQIKNSR